MEETNNFYAEVKEAGRVIIPKTLRKLLKLEIGDTVELRIVKVYKAVKK